MEVILWRRLLFMAVPDVCRKLGWTTLVFSQKSVTGINP
jgi:hypothetical protein